MDPRKNPYRPAAGVSPSVLIGRNQELETFDVLLARLEQGIGEQFPLIYGLRGVGKTVLLNAYEDLAIARGWHATVREAGSGSSLGEIIASWVESSLIYLAPAKSRVDRAISQLRALKSFTVSVSSTSDVSVSLGTTSGGHERLAHDLTLLLVELGNLAAAKQSGTVLLLDEAHCLSTEEVAPLLGAIHRAAQKGLPVSVVTAGLPQLPIVVAKAKSYSERLFTFISIGKLDRLEASEAIIGPAKEKNVEWETKAVDAVLDYSEGYPFFIQQYAKYSWLSAKGEVITEGDVHSGSTHALQALDEGFFSNRLGRMTPNQRAYIRAMATVGHPPLTRDVAAKLGGDQNRWSRVREQLIQKGMIYSSARGQIDFTVPRFGEFVHRHRDLVN